MGFVARGEGDLLGSSAAELLEAGGRESTVQGGERSVVARVYMSRLGYPG